MKRAHYLETIITGVPGRVVHARVMRLEAYGHVPPHVDPWHSTRTGLVRMQIPVSGDADALLEVDGYALQLRDAALWYVDVSRPHCVTNNTGTPRLNILLDVEITKDSIAAFEGCIPRDECLATDFVQVSLELLHMCECVIEIPRDLAPLLGGCGLTEVYPHDGALWLRYPDGSRVQAWYQGEGGFGVVGAPPGVLLQFSPRSVGHLPTDVPTLHVNLRGSGYGTGRDAGLIQLTTRPARRR